MKLELKQLAPYLPYELKFITPKHRIKYGEQTILTARGLSLQDDLSLNIEFLFDNELYFSNEMKSCTPILRHCNDFDKEITHNGNTFIPYDLAKSVVSEKQWALIVETVTKDYTKWVDFPYWYVRLLLEWHFDIFGLIDNGLAVNINEVTNYDR